LQKGRGQVESKELATKVMDTICSLAFSEGGGAQQVRCLELLAKLLGLQERSDCGDVTIVEDV